MSTTTVTAFAVRADQLRARMDVGYALEQVSRKQAGGWPTKRLGEMALLVQYGSSSLASADQLSHPMLRMNNLQDDGWDLTDLKYVQFEAAELERYRLFPGDILVNRTNGTRELVGKSQVFDLEGTWVFASYLIRIRVDTTQVLPEYVAAFLNSDTGRSNVTASSRQILQTNISGRELRALEIPLPPLDVQRALVAQLSLALKQRDDRLTEADATLQGIGDKFMDLLGLPQPPASLPNAYTLPLGQLQGSRIDASAHRPVYNSKSLPQSISTAPLSAFAEIDPERPRPLDESVPYVGLPECDVLDVRSKKYRPLSEVRTRKTFSRGDLLFARIEPSVFNMKYPWARSSLLAQDQGVYTSTEFYIVAAREGADLAYIFAALRSPFVQAQVRGRTTGSSGRRRLDRLVFSTLEIPVKDGETSAKIAHSTAEAIDRIESLRAAATSDWAKAKRVFDDVVSGQGSYTQNER